MTNESIAPWTRILNPNQFFGSILIGVISGGIAGMAAGILARAAMRVVAVLGGMTPAFSTGGTLGILLIGVLLGIGPGILYAISLPVWHASPGRKGWTMGAVLAALLTGVLFSVDLEGELALAPIWVVAAMFGAIAVAYGGVLGIVAGRVTPPNADAIPDSGSFVRTAGLLTLIGGLLSGLSELFLAAAFPAATAIGVRPALFLENLTGTGTILAIIAGLAGLLRSRAAGDSGPVTAGLGITLAGFTLLGMGSVFQGIGMIKLHGLIRVINLLEYNPDLFSLLVLLGAGIVFMLAAGIAVLRARRWAGWRRAIPLAVGLVPALSIPILHPAMLPSALGVSVFGRIQLGHWVGAVYGLTWLALGIALRMEAARPDPAPTAGGDV